MERVKKPYNLHELVEKTSEAHRKDIQLYTKGHLNFNKFTKNSSEKNLHTSIWKTSREKPKKVLSDDSVIQSKAKMQKMSDALFDFSLGSSGIIPVQKSSSAISLSPLAPTRSQEKVELEVLQKVENNFVDNGRASTSIKRESEPVSSSVPVFSSEKKLLTAQKRPQNSKVCVEEMKLPELMLSPIDSTVDIPPSIQIARSPAGKSIERKKFITTHLAGITSKDQFQKLIDFEENILQTSELKERNIYDGHKAVSHLENKLVSKLLLLQIREPSAGPSFERLQIYSDVWSDLAMDSAIFGELFGEIKDEYDNYLSYLLDVVKSSDRADLLRSQHVIDDESSKLKSKKAKSLRREVEDLENNCREALIRNYTLHEQINEELWKIEEEARQKEKEEEDSMRKPTPKKKSDKYTSSLAAVSLQRSSKPVTTTAKDKSIQNMRTDIWVKIDAIKELKKKLKDDYVPKTLHRNVLHAIKDTELEIQKLHQQHAYLSQHKEETTEQMKTSLNVERVSNEDKTKIWQMIQTNVAMQK